jgi:hypothetical protein
VVRMSNKNGRKYGFTALFPVKAGRHSDDLRCYLRSLDDPEKYPRGSPFAAIDVIHQTRFVVIDHLPFQGFPAKYDSLRSNCLLFACDFDGDSPDEVVLEMIRCVPATMDEIWDHCVGYPSIATTAPERLTSYFRRYQLQTSLFFADQEDARVPEILHALSLKQRFSDFVRDHQADKPTAELQQLFFAKFAANG